KAQDTSELFFNDVRVPRDNLLGQEGMGCIHLMQELPQERLSSAIMGAAAMEAILESTVEYVKERNAFGRPIAAFQNTQFKLAELRTELDLAQCHVDQCVRAFNAGKLTAIDAAKAKLVTSELQVKSADLGVQLHGGAGYMDEYPISRQFTDARIAPIYAGASEVMKLIISRDCLGDAYEPFNTRNF
ncbi:MAG: acyl-CoA dehydrogenase family protein, partial [Myxococcota bacterium]